MKIDWDLFTFPFDDKHWASKFAIGAGLALVATYLWLPFFWLYLPVGGYGLRIMRKTARGERPSLPEWDDWGELFADGLRVFVVSLVYMLPVVVLLMCVYVAWFGVGFGLPLMMGSSRGAAGRAMIPVILGAYGLSFLLFALVFLLAIPLGFLAISAISRLAVTGSVSKAFEVGEVWALLKRGFKHYVIAYLVLMAVAMVVSQVSAITIIVCCVYPFIQAMAVFYIQTQQGALIGMAYFNTENPGPAKGDAPAAALRDTGPLAKTAPLVAKPVEAPAAPPDEKDDASTDEVPVVKPAANLVETVRGTDKTQAGDAPDIKPAEEEAAPKKRRASTPRKKKPTGGEDQP